MRQIRPIAAMIAMSVPLVLLAACGGGNDGDTGLQTSTPASTATSRPVTRAATGTAVPAQTAVAIPTDDRNAVPSVPAAQPTAGPATVAPTRPAPPPPPPPPPPPATPVPPPPPGPVALSIAAKDVKFVPSGLSAPAGSTVTVTLDNQDASVQHDIVFFNPSGDGIGGTELSVGPSVTSVTFSVGGAGRYPFKCSVHPQQMTGALAVN